MKNSRNLITVVALSFFMSFGAVHATNTISETVNIEKVSEEGDKKDKKKKKGKKCTAEQKAACAKGGEKPACCSSKAKK